LVAPGVNNLTVSSLTLSGTATVNVGTLSAYTRVAALKVNNALSVNGVTVTSAEVALARYWAKLEAPYQASDDAKVTALAVDKVVADILLASEASAAGEALGKKETKEGIAAFRNRVGGEAAYQDVLRVTGASEDDLARLVERHRLARRYVEQRIAPAVTVSEDEARAWYEQPGHQVHHFDQIRIRLIFINSKEGESADAEAKARERIEAAAARIGGGEDFAAVARAVSEDLSRQIGGEIGWISRGAILGQMEDLVWRLDTGATSGVLHGPYGFALIQIVDRRPAGPSPSEEVRDSVISDLEADRTAQAVAAAVAELRSKTTITVLDPSLGWSPG
jgi:parvulin-like peptidyl-prolyl isomerase